MKETLKPHICFVAPSAYPVLAGNGAIPVVGGAEVQQVMIAKGLAARGYRVSMICLDFGQPAVTEVHGVRVLKAYKPDEGLPLLRYFWPRMTMIWRCMRRADADLYYQRTAGTLTGVVAAFCEWTRKKSVFAVAGMPFVPHWRERVVYRYGLRHVSSVCVQNDEQRLLVKRSVGRDSTLLANCVQPVSMSNVAEGDRILWVATIRSVKQPHLFLDLAERLPEFRFSMVGGRAMDEPLLFEAIEARARTLRNVEFLGFLPLANVQECYRTAALLVNTSESEGFPNTFLEAWASAVPTVSFVDCGARLDGSAIGRTVGTLQSMVEEVRRLMSDADDRVRVGLACRQYVERYHSLEMVLDAYERMIANVLAGDESSCGQ